MKNHAVKNAHTRFQSLIFRGKSRVLQFKRGFENTFDSNIKRHSASQNLRDAPVIAESKTPLWTESAPQ